jgi:hypothetical protein
MRKFMMFSCAGMLLALATGCTQNSQVVRGQNAGAYPMASGEYCMDDCEYCSDGSCSHCQPYCIPGDLVYPPPNDMPGIVQYPYYTHKGPDCFFHQ